MNDQPFPPALMAVLTTEQRAEAAEGVGLESMWAKIEFPILRQNPAVNLIYHVIGGE